MRKLIIRVVRFLLVKLIGIKHVKTVIVALARLARIDLLMLTYQSWEISKYSNSTVSGEDFVISSVLKKYFQKEDLIIFDVGANAGDYLIKIKTEFSNAKIYAFEPNCNTFNILKTKSNVNVNCYNLGLSSKSLNQKLYTYAGEKNSEHASIYKNVLLDLHKAKNIVELDFCNTTIDEFCKINKIDFIDFIKIDTEGHELEVMQGATRMISENRINIIQFEFNEMNIISRVFLKDFYEILKDYNIYRLNSNNLIPLFEYSSTNEIFKFQNFLAISKKFPFLV